LAIASIAAVAALIVAYRWRMNAGPPAIASTFESTRDTVPDRSPTNLDSGAVEPPSDSIREAVPAAARSPAESKPTGSTPDTAMLLVRTIDKLSREPLAGIAVEAWRNGDAGDPWQGSDPSASRADPARPPVTDENGRAELEVPPGIDLTVGAHGREMECEARFMEVPSLRRGERRELLVELGRGDDLQLFGRVIDAVESKPIRGAVVRVCVAGFGGERRDRNSEKLSQTTTDANGSFELRLPSWRHPFVRVEADGFGVAVLRRPEGRYPRS
jgi:hypothetical protein